MSSRESVRLAAPVLGAAVLVAVAASSLPWRAGVFIPPNTPFANSAAFHLGPGFLLLRDAEGVIPRDASVVVRTDPADLVQETELHRLALALLPGREILPAAYYGQATGPDVWGRAEYVVVLGRRPAEPAGTLLLLTGQGTVWRRPPESPGHP